MPETPETAELDPRIPGPQLGQVMTQLLAVLVDRPTLFVIEDAHWMDEASADLLRYLTTSIAWAPCLFCYTRRDVESGFVGREPDVSRMKLAPLDGAAATELIEMTMSTHRCRHRRPPSWPSVRAAIRSSCESSSPRRTRAGTSTRSPTRWRPSIAARIDRLSATDRHFLRRVSVLGRSAPRELLGAVLEAVPDPADELWHRLAEFIAPDEQGNLVFRHALLRDGAYDGLSYRLRRELHGRVADSLLLAAGAQPDEWAESLSLHYLHAQRFEEAWRYSLKAAGRAGAVYANFEASEFFERALVAAAAAHRP